MNGDKRLMTVKKASQVTGLSISFLESLVQRGRLTGHYINTARLISMVELESIAITKKDRQSVTYDYKN